MWWIAGLVGVIVYTLVKFVLFKPTKLPKPEKDHKSIRLSPIHSNFSNEIIQPIKEDCSYENDNHNEISLSDQNLHFSSTPETELIVDLNRSSDKITMTTTENKFKDKNV